MSTSFVSKLKEICLLLVLNLRVKVTNFFEYLQVVINYYPSSLFRNIDSTLLLAYLFKNPFQISKHFLMHQGAQDIYTYGETPLTTLELIAKTCEIQPQDVVFELGCGRGRTCFWLHQFIGCRVVGIDYVPTFIKHAQKIQARFNLCRISFQLNDLFCADLTGATVIYLYGTCFSETSIDQLIIRLTDLPKGTKIITVSYALVDFLPTAPFKILQQFKAAFTWGITDVYLQIKT